MNVTATTNSDRLIAEMKKFREATGKDIRESLKAHARLACVDLAFQTQPWGNTEKGKQYGETAVLRDISKVYSTSKSESFYNNTSSIAAAYYEATASKSSDPEKTKLSPQELTSRFQDRFKGYQDSGNIVALGYIAKCMKFKGVLYDEFDASYHKRSRDARGRVRKSLIQRMLVLGAENELDNYKETVKNRVGLTKAGWAACANKIVITGRASSATREFPAWVKRHLGRAQGQVQDNTSNPNYPHVVMINETPWTSQVLSPSAAKRALQQAEDDYVKYMQIVTQKTLEKTYDGVK